MSVQRPDGRSRAITSPVAAVTATHVSANDPGAPVGRNATSPSGVNVGASTSPSAVGDGTLTKPGRYLFFCAVPTGADPRVWMAAAQKANGPVDPAHRDCCDML